MLLENDGKKETLKRKLRDVGKRYSAAVCAVISCLP